MKQDNTTNDSPPQFMYEGSQKYKNMNFFLKDNFTNGSTVINEITITQSKSECIFFTHLHSEYFITNT